MAVSWLLVEFFVLTALRAGSEGTFRFQIFGTDTVLGSLVLDIVLYVLSIGAPLFVLRFPGESGFGSVEQDFVTTNNATSSLNKATLGPVSTCRGASTSLQ